jgi:diacylglycerol O-acyltransferase-1
MLIGWTFPLVIGYVYDTSPPLTLTALLVPGAGSLKMISFIHTCSNIRYLFKEKSTDGVEDIMADEIMKYPKCLTYSRFCYFLFAPTCCFELWYPRTKGIRWIWLAKRLVEFVISGALFLFICEQFLTPALMNTMPLLKETPLNYTLVFERLLKLSVPSTCIWLLWFVFGFHLWLNIVAEVMCFADRTFYEDWWNSHTMGDYWRLWNKPIHNWFVRHFFIPMKSWSGSTIFSMTYTFFVSAILHEWLIGGACHVLTIVSVLAMFSQVPVIILMEAFKEVFKTSQLGNVVFWLSFCVFGQPLGILTYTYLVLSKSEAN